MHELTEVKYPPFVNIYKGVQPQDAKAVLLSRLPPNPSADQIAEWQPPGPPFPPDSECYVKGCWRYMVSGPGSIERVTSALPQLPSPVGVGRSEVSLKRRAGTFVVPVTINGSLRLDFMIDSGASDVSIPADVAMTLFRTGTIQESDFTGTRTYRLADGSTVPSPTFRIRVLKVGDREVRDILGSVSSVKGSLLLGQSFLSRFHSWSINNERQVLILD
jgi:clan AA aspartic protease (TIGR02281 family)